MNLPEIGVQSFTYRQFDIPGIIKELKDTDITALELWGKHLNPDMDPDEIEKAKKQLSDAGMRVCGIGVCSFSSEGPGEIRKTLEFGADLGCDYVSIDVPADDNDAKEELVERAKEFSLLLGIHNHGPGHHYDTAQSVLESCEGYDSVLGACVDFGHYLRVDETPEQVIETLKDRVNAVHLKDFIDADTEVVPGTGKLDYGATLDALEEKTGFDTAFVIEFEADPDNPTAGMQQTVGVFKQALEKLQ
ncbi:MAG: sugar phosphate isomerase/epimerase family protein [Candidatus Brocadiia bacterium]|nr:sugar phosphate isomerase/epimerase [Planctomycetota bacterium]